MTDLAVRAITPRRLEILAAVGREQSIRRAAHELFISQPTVRDALDALEAVIGGPLKDTRDGDAPGLYRLSAIGRQVVEQGEAILNLCEGVTRLGERRPPAVAFLPHHAPLLARAWANLDDQAAMDLQVLGESERSTSAFANRVLGRLEAGAIAVAVGHPAVDRPKLDSQPLYDVDYEAMLPAAWRPKTISIAQLAERRLVLPPAPTRSRVVLEEAFKAAGLTEDREVVLEAYQTKVLVLMGWAGLGTVVLPSDLARLYKTGGDFGGPQAKGVRWVKVVSGNGQRLVHQVNVTTSRDRSTKVERVIAAIREAVGQLGYDAPSKPAA